MKSRRLAVVILYGTYSYLHKILSWVVDCMPPPIRTLILRAMLSRLGRDAFIDYGVYFRYPKNIRIGKHVSINRGCEFYSSMRAKTGAIVIGDNVTLGPSVKMFAATHDYSDLDLPDTGKSITIGNYVWVGASATILPGVELGEGAVIGAGAVVTRSVPAYCVAVGNPARVIKNRVLKRRLTSQEPAALSN